MELKQLIVEAWGNRELLKESKYADAVRGVIEEVDKENWGWGGLPVDEYRALKKAKSA